MHTVFMQLPEAGIFNQPVDVEGLGLTDYYTVVAEPMDLGTVFDGLFSRTYRHVADYVKHVHLVFENAMAYNLPGSDVYLNALALMQRFDAEIFNITGYRMESTGQPAQVGVEPQMPRRQTRAMHRRLMSRPEAEPFNVPVPPTNVDYYHSIPRPMDFGTILSALEADQYLSLDAYANDVRQVFANTRAYYEPGSALYESTVPLSDFFETEFATLVERVAPTPATPNVDQPEPPAELPPPTSTSGRPSRQRRRVTYYADDIEEEEARPPKRARRERTPAQSYLSSPPASPANGRPRRARRQNYAELAEVEPSFVRRTTRRREY